MASGPKVDESDGSFRRIFGGESVVGMDEAELLRRFATRRDPSALEAIVVRHGPMVLGVCRRILLNRHSSEDAFQATFLVLARRAGTIRDPDRLGPWLHGVAHRVALRLRAERARLQARERTGTEEPAMATDQAESDFDRAELRATLDEEIRRLPSKFRDPIILCYLDGLTHDEAAVHLQCPVGTVRSRLATGRDRLRDRLTRRGVTVASGVFASVLTAEFASAAVSPVLLVSTVRASTAFASSMKAATTAGLVSASVAALAEGVTTTMIVSKLKIIGALALTGILTLGVGGATAQKLGGSGEGEKIAQKSPDLLEDQIAKLKAQATEAEARAQKLDAEIKALKDQLETAKIINDQVSKRMAKLSANNQPAVAAGMMPGRTVEAGIGKTGATGLPAMGGAPARASSGTLTGLLDPRQYGGGMGGLGQIDSQSLATFQTDDYVVVHKPRSEKITAYSVASGECFSYVIPKGVEVRPIGTHDVVALSETGETIGQLAVFVPSSGKWYPIDLKEPAKKITTPTVGFQLVAYTIGRRVYAFSAKALAWDILELREDAKPVAYVGNNRVTVESDGHLYIFSGKTGKWTDFDANTGQVVIPEKK